MTQDFETCLKAEGLVAIRRGGADHWEFYKDEKFLGRLRPQRPVWPAFVLGVAVGVLVASIAVLISRLPM